MADSIGLPTVNCCVSKLHKEGNSYSFVNTNFSLSEILDSDCKDNYLVPKVVHYVTIGNWKFWFIHYIAVLSAYKRIKPCYIVYHGNVLPNGTWWHTLMTQIDNVLFEYREIPTTIYGHKLAYIEHSADVMRLQILIQHGGIYFDTDSVALSSFDPLRKYSLTLDEDTNKISASNNAMVAAPGNPVLKMWLLAYHDYRTDWGHNSVLMSYRIVALVPNIVHMELHKMVLPGTGQELDQSTNKWTDGAYSVHLFARFLKKKDIDIDDIQKGYSTIAQICRYTLYDSILEK